LPFAPLILVYFDPCITIAGDEGCGSVAVFGAVVFLAELELLIRAGAGYSEGIFTVEKHVSAMTSLGSDRLDAAE
jgi:hypothetical protein